MNSTTKKIDIDSLFEADLVRQQNKKENFNKILYTIHNKIKYISRQRINNKLLVYRVPQFKFNVFNFNLDECIDYLINNLEDNGFIVKFTNPNVLLISWNDYIPSHKREEIKKQFGINIDGFGNEIQKKNSVYFNNKKNQINKNNNIIYNSHNITNNNKNLINNNHKITNNNKNNKLTYNPNPFLETIHVNNNISNNKNNKNENENYRDPKSYKPKGIYNIDLIKSIKNIN